MSYNFDLKKDKKIDIQLHKNDRASRPLESFIENSIKDKKKSNQYEKNFFKWFFLFLMIF